MSNSPWSPAVLSPLGGVDRATGSVPTTPDGRIRALEGLRAVAVVLVLLYHADLGVRGGFIGVDVFFVVSGYLITSILVAERRATGRTGIRAFYGRRARRLIPASALVTASTLVAGWFVLDPIARRELGTDSVWATLFAANIRLANTGAAYLKTVDIPSALQHYWSLAVEEQFYVVWPLILVGAWRVLRGNRHAITVAFGALAAVSLTVCIVQTPYDAVWSYFAPWTRGWELAAGGLLAAGVMEGRRHTLRPVVANLLGTAGLATIVATAFMFSERTQFPGWAAVFPVVGTMAVLAPITAHTPVNTLLAVRPMTWIGERSYSLYLWHWPILVLAGVQWDGLTAPQRGAALVAALALSALSYMFVENPVRHHPLLVRRANVSLAVGAAITVAVTAGAFAVSRSDASTHTGFVAGTTSVPVETTTPVADLADRIRFEESRLQSLIAASVAQPLVPDNLTPKPADAAKADVAGADIGCLAGFRDLQSPECALGDTGSDTTVVLFGDSHSAQWLPALQQAGTDNGWRIEVLTKRACPSSGETVPRTPTTKYPECDTWRENSLARIEREKPALVIMSNWRYKNSSPSYAEALEPTVARISATGAKVVILADTPTAGFGVPQCVADNPTAVTRCGFAAAGALSSGRRATEQRIVAAHGGEWIDTLGWVCDTSSGTCPAVIGDVLAYRDRDHITETWSGSLTTVLGLHVRRVLQR